MAFSRSPIAPSRRVVAMLVMWPSEKFAAISYCSLALRPFQLGMDSRDEMYGVRNASCRPWLSDKLQDGRIHWDDSIQTRYIRGIFTSGASRPAGCNVP
jgi:hypothetical protein